MNGAFGMPRAFDCIFASELANNDAMGLRAVALSSEDEAGQDAEPDSDFEQEARRVLRDELADKVAASKPKRRGPKPKAETKKARGARKADAPAAAEAGSDGDEADVLKQYRRRQKKSGRAYEQMSRRQVAPHSSSLSIYAHDCISTLGGPRIRRQPACSTSE